MRAQPPEYNRTEHKDHTCYRPEIDGQSRMLPEPDFVNEAVPISFNNIINWIQFDVPLVFFRHKLERPEYRSQPEPKL